MSRRKLIFDHSSFTGSPALPPIPWVKIETLIKRQIPKRSRVKIRKSTEDYFFHSLFECHAPPKKAIVRNLENISTKAKKLFKELAGDAPAGDPEADAKFAAKTLVAREISRRTTCTSMDSQSKTDADPIEAMTLALRDLIFAAGSLLETPGMGIPQDSPFIEADKQWDHWIC